MPSKKWPDELRSGDTSTGLRKLAAETGGILYDPPAQEDYSEILARIEADLRNRYILSFLPQPGPGGRHALRIEVPSGLTVRARTEYFDSAK